ncbi:MAG: recombinase family protein [Muribaculum sp.]|nr:recombinase family protein [Muribaculum sp.]
MTTNRPYVLWRRVSTKHQSDSGLGLEAQQSIAEYFMHSEPKCVFTDVYTGTKLSECKKLAKAIKYAKENNYLLVIAKTDRFRNVIEALQVLDAVGEGNLCFCDLPTTDRTVLTMVFAMWERQAMMGRINTRIALEERKKQLRENGSFISKSGNICTHLGRPALIDDDGNEYYDMSAAVEAASRLRSDNAIAWREQSKAVKFALRKRAEGWGVLQIADELGKLYEDSPEVYCTPKGCKPSKGTISKWLRESNPLAV